jgi:hypothetical protein
MRSNSDSEMDRLFVFEYAFANCCRYLSQVRQELAIRLLTRLYPGGEGPSKVSPPPPLCLNYGILIVYSSGLVLQRESSWEKVYRCYVSVDVNTR